VAEFIGVANLLEGTLLQPAGEGDNSVLVRVGGEGGTLVRCLGGASALSGRVAVLVRPEWVTIHEAPPPGAEENVLRVVLHGSQYLGDRIELLVRSGDEQLRVVAGGDAAYRDGQELHLEIDGGRCIALPLG
jgi:ABC-type Fe3+/spermidine/putrescine transport system ATPase subunit